jgi:hypothetical protein
MKTSHDLKQMKRLGETHPPDNFITRSKCFWIGLQIVCVFMLILFHASPVSARQGGHINIQPPDISRFPTITVQFKLTDSTSQPVDQLQPQQLSLYENETRVEITNLESAYSGFFYALVINPGRDLDLRDAEGVSRYAKLQDVLQAWINKRSNLPVEQWGFVTQTGVLIRTTDDLRTWTREITDYAPDFRSLQPDLTALETAIFLSSNLVLPFGADKVMLYISPPPSAEEIPRLYELAEQAAEAEIHINVWMVSEPLYFTNDQGKALMDLAAATGGEFFSFSGSEAIPDPKGQLQGYGTTFTATYQSTLKEGGIYPLKLQIQLPETTITGGSQPFDINIQPPNPIFVSPPTTITRQAPPEAKDPLASLIPTVFNLDLLIEFPDEHPREILKVNFYVDGVLQKSKTSPPFDQITWDLMPYTEAGEHFLQVEVQDILGLTGQTIPIPVQVDIKLPESENNPALVEMIRWTIFIILGISVVIFLFWSLKNILKRRQLHRQRMQGKNDNRQPAADPLLDQQEIMAKLIPLQTTELENEPKPLVKDITTLGSHPQKTDLTLKNPFIDPVHARVTFQNKHFWLKDLGSTGGTWRNYQKIGTESVQIKTGDILHFGTSGFRFRIVEKVFRRKIKITPYEPFL